MKAYKGLLTGLLIAVFALVGGFGLVSAQGQSDDRSSKMSTRVDADEDAEEDDLEIEAEAEDGKTEVEVEYADGTEEEFNFDTTDRSEVISHLVDETDLTEDEIEAVLDFEVDDDENDECEEDEKDDDSASSTDEDADDECEEDDEDDDEDKEDNDMVTLCHQTGASDVTLEVNKSAKRAHLNHGDSVGACDGDTGTSTDEDNEDDDEEFDFELSDATPEQLQNIIDQLMERLQGLLDQLTG